MQVDDDNSDSMLASWQVPSIERMQTHLDELAGQCQVTKRALSALETGMFSDELQGAESIHDIDIPLDQLALLAWLARHCTTPLSLEAGFGMGITTSIMLSARAAAGKPFNHLAFDPFGLGENRGELVEQFLQRQFGDRFSRIRERSQFGIANLAAAGGPNQCGLVYIDGDHSFEGALSDFYVADKLLTIGGFIVFDDGSYPAIETVVGYIKHNRKDYEVSHLEVTNTSVIKKISLDHRRWDHFRPFHVPDRNDWTTAPF
ncbi:MAG: class I SAM-dependent methyltransferase [Rubripirellula sp.]